MCVCDVQVCEYVCGYRVCRFKYVHTCICMSYIGMYMNMHLCMCVCMVYVLFLDTNF